MAKTNSRKRIVSSGVIADRKRGSGSASRRRAGAAPFSAPPPMAALIDLPTFRETATTLTPAERLTLIDQALVLLQDNYAHLPLKESMHGVRPIQKLRLLRALVEEASDSLTDLDFHGEMLSIFISLRDLHTNYILPQPYKSMTAFLPFIVESYFENGKRRFVVATFFQGFSSPPFGVGVTVTHWNGVPIDRAVGLIADRFAGSNKDARLARGIEGLTIRPLITGLPPDEDFALIGYDTGDGQEREVRIDWQVFQPDQAEELAASLASVDESAIALGVDIEHDMVRLAKRSLFVPEVVSMDAAILGGAELPAASGAEVPSMLPSVITAKSVSVDQVDYGYVRIRTFNVDPTAFVAEFIRLVRQLPDNGLIIDVRGNGGGIITSGERLLQLLTPDDIEPEAAQFINTSLNLEICRRNPFLSEWIESIAESVRTGAVYSRGFTITSTEEANDTGQAYSGPVVLITDALCYSTTDIFAAGFQDHEIGPVIGVDGNTGAGGANVWTHALLSQLAGPGGPYRQLPQGAALRVAVRRTLRRGEHAGTPLEDLGVRPDIPYQMTRNDVLNGNEDLIAAAAGVLADQPVHKLGVQSVSDANGDLAVQVSTLGLDRIDTYVDLRPLGSVDVSDGVTDLTVTGAAHSMVELFGYASGDLASSAVIDRS
jgi:hypothetical protein